MQNGTVQKHKILMKLSLFPNKISQSKWKSRENNEFMVKFDLAQHLNIL